MSLSRAQIRDHIVNALVTAIATLFLTFGTGVGGATGQPCRMILAEICIFNYAMNSTDRASLLAYYKSLYGMSFL